jgi:hypothetical protein
MNYIGAYFYATKSHGRICKNELTGISLNKEV